MRWTWAGTGSLALVIVGAAACGSEGDDGQGGSGASAVTGTGAGDAGGMGSTSSSGGNGTGGNAVGGSAPMGPDVDVSDPQLYELELEPEVLDPSCVDSLETQYAQLDTRATPVGQLVVFLSGSTNIPRNWRDHGRKLAEFGFHVLVPHYNNRWSNEGACSGQPSGCSVNTRWEAITGEDTSGAIDISRADSAEGRVVAMLQHLVTAHPQGDWGWFLDNGEPRYGDIIIAGISHGAASTGLYAERRTFARAVLHSGGPAGDTQATKLTPIASWFGFAHTDDPAYNSIINGCMAHGMIGSVTTIDQAIPPYDNANLLISSQTSTYPHCSTAVGSGSPMANNGFAFEDAWRYLYGVAP